MSGNNKLNLQATLAFEILDEKRLNSIAESRQCLHINKKTHVPLLTELDKARPSYPLQHITMHKAWVI